MVFIGFCMIWKYLGGQFDLSQRAVVMGILNLTPDSFSDGGVNDCVDAAVANALKMVQEGAEIIDVGGESTRPGSPQVSVQEEMDRTIPVIEALNNEWGGAISIDTSKHEVAREAIEAGAHIVNDVTGLQDPEMVLVCRDAGVGIVAMHMQGNPRTMQKSPEYGNVVSEIREFFEQQYELLTVAGIPPEYLCFDPGIGFGKNLDHNEALLNEVASLEVAGRPVLIGLSRKSFIGELLSSDKLEDREWPTTALTAMTRKLGARVHRVHSVKQNVQAVRMVEAILNV